MNDPARNFIARAIGELIYEEVLPLEILGPNQGRVLGHYTFHYIMGVWGWPMISAHTLSKDVSPFRFILQLGEHLGSSHSFVQKFLEEIAASQWVDQLQSKLPSLTYDELLALPETKRQAYYPGHPKILANKGRVGWSTRDHALYGPEQTQGFQLHWIGIDPDLVNISGPYDQAMGLNDQRLAQYPHYVLIPVHPWQWAHKIEPLFQELIIQEKIISLGEIGPRYWPQISLRSLSPLENPDLDDLKLPLSILNTSSYRGLKREHLEMAPQFSETLAELCSSDPFLQNVRVQQETKTVFVAHPELTRLTQGSYQYHEILGAVWRQSASALTDKTYLMTGALQYRAPESTQSLLVHLIERSGLIARDWMQLYTRQVILPLYHLLTKYHLGVVAHGQNTQLILDHYQPAGLILKDFGGDIRLGRDASTEWKERGISSELPPDYLVHDLFTGHFVSVLRFLSLDLEVAGLLSEREFYALIHGAISAYNHRYPEGTQAYSLLQSPMPKVLLNPVRFQLGYEETQERLKPALGTPLTNPLLLESL